MERKYIPLSVPNLRGKELEYVTEAIQSEWVSTGGPFVQEFENKIAAYVGAVGAVSVQNGTSGLHVALHVCGVTSGDEVIVPSLTFIAAVNPVKYLGAEPVFMDCDETLCMDTRKLARFCRDECSFVDGKLINKKSKRHIKAIIVVHVFGNMADLEKLMEIACSYNLQVIEDATEAIGTFYKEGKYKDKYAGTIGHVGVYSFNGNKIMTTGGGGMIVSQNESLLKRAKHLTTQAKSDELYYIHDEIGYNYRMTNLQAALGLAQLEKLEEFIKIKERNYLLYKEQIREMQGLTLLDFLPHVRSNYWFYALYIDNQYPLSRDEAIHYFASKGVQVRPIWGLVHEQKPYLHHQVYQVDRAKDYWEHVINLPCSSNLEPEEVGYIVELLRNI